MAEILPLRGPRRYGPAGVRSSSEYEELCRMARRLDELGFPAFAWLLASAALEVHGRPPDGAAATGGEPPVRRAGRVAE